ncbi:hypothetical protein TRICI_002448 [Trichomonascus ciferrii]|uniref:Gag1-like clamp domain-containing protein n=1 Tax=Trichomonascus ciferrii TaxID=44093 RepID=A0A642V709_9ASCO|nr:hypothetical protein TRICI_002448 [Trichomonascus ciferrii]
MGFKWFRRLRRGMSRRGCSAEHDEAVVVSIEHMFVREGEEAVVQEEAQGQVQPVVRVEPELPVPVPGSADGVTAAEGAAPVVVQNLTPRSTATTTTTTSSTPGMHDDDGERSASVTSATTTHDDDADERPVGYDEWVRIRERWTKGTCAHATTPDEFENYEHSQLKHIPPTAYPRMYKMLVKENRPLKEPLNLADALKIIKAGWEADGTWPSPDQLQN